MAIESGDGVLRRAEASHYAARFIQNLTVVTVGQQTALLLALTERQTFPAEALVSQLQRFLAGSVLVHDGGDHAEVAEVAFAPLAGHDLHARVSQQFSMRQRTEHVLAGHAALFREQHRVAHTALGGFQQAWKLRAMS